MKKVFVLSAFALGLTLMSFNPKEQSAFEIQTDGNYKIVNSNSISQEDIDFLISETTEFSGTKKRKTCSVFCTSAISSEITETVTVKESNKDDDKPDQIVASKVDMIIQKYMK